MSFRETVVTDAGPAFEGPARGEVVADKYRVGAPLGRGGMGVVFRAEHVTLGEPVALKVLRDDARAEPENVARFVREAQAAARLKSPHVARIHDVGELASGAPFMVMELLEGKDLGRVLEEHGKVDLTLAVDLVLGACDALAEAHALGIVHRDIKPSNLFLARQRDGSALVKVLDFGISKAPVGMDLKLTQTQSLLGTPSYMSPEQMRSASRVDARTDLWSLGAVLYELVERRLPFVSESFAELCVMVMTEPPAPMTAAPALAPIIERCLAKAAADRYPSVGDLALDLAPFSSDPDRFTRQAQRMLRVLGRVDARGSMDPSASTSGAGLIAVGPVVAPTTLGVRRRSSGRWIASSAVAVVLGAAAVAGMQLWGRNEAAAVSASAPVADEPAAMTRGAPSPVEPAQPAEPAPARPAPAAAADSAADAAADPVRGTATDEPPPSRRDRHRRATRHRVPRPAARPAAAPSEPCDAYGNRKGC